LGSAPTFPPCKTSASDVTLVEQSDECPTKYLNGRCEKSGIAKDAVASTPITRCIAVKSEKGRQYPGFIQDALAGSLAKDVQPGGTLTVYGSLSSFVAARGPGIVVNEYSTQQTTTPQSHSGIDLSAASKKKLMAAKPQLPPVFPARCRLTPRLRPRGVGAGEPPLRRGRGSAGATHMRVRQDRGQCRRPRAATGVAAE